MGESNKRINDLSEFQKYELSSESVNNIRKQIDIARKEFEKEKETFYSEHDNFRKRLTARQGVIEKELQKRQEHLENIEKDLHSRNLELEIREKKISTDLAEKYKNIDLTILKRNAEIDQRRYEFENEIKAERRVFDNKKNDIEKQLKEKAEILEKLTSEVEASKLQFHKDFQERIKQTSQSFVTKALDELSTKVQYFQEISRNWSVAGATFLFLGLLYFMYLTNETAKSTPAEITWQFITFSILKGFIGISLLLVLARYAYQLSGYYMQESLKNSDRKHAINFGKFYLETYGATAEWSQVKEAFENWNINSSSGFSKLDTDKINLASIEKATAIVEKVSKLAPSILGKSEKEKN